MEGKVQLGHLYDIASHGISNVGVEEMLLSLTTLMDRTFCLLSR